MHIVDFVLGNGQAALLGTPGKLKSIRKGLEITRGDWVRLSTDDTVITEKIDLVTHPF